MLPQQRKGWTTVTDIEQFKKMTWCYLTNVKMMWQYQGMAYLFRKEGIPLYGKDLGTMKTNHPIVCMAIPQSKDKNYGVDIYVPVEACGEDHSRSGADQGVRPARGLRRGEEGA